MDGDFEIVGRVTVDSSGAATLDNVNGSLDKMQSKTSLLSNVTKAFGDIAHFVWANLVLQGVQMAGRAISEFLSDMVKKGEEAQLAQAQLVSVIKSTGGAAGISAEQVNQMAEKMMLLTKFDDEAYVSASTMILQFTKIGKEVFPQAIQASADLATRLGIDLPSAAQMIGKALGDPEQGIGRLNMAFRLFNDEQMKTVENLAKTGHVAEAQQMILDALSKSIGGAAEAAGNTFAGKVDILKNRIDNMKESIFDWLSASPMVSQFFDIAEEGVANLGNFIKDITSGENLADALGDLGIPKDAALRIQAIGLDIQRIFGGLAKGDLKTAFLNIGDLWKNLTSDFEAAFKKIDWKKASQDLAKGIQKIDWNQLGKDLITGLSSILEGLWAFLSGVDWGALFVSIGTAFLQFAAGLAGYNWSDVVAQWTGLIDTFKTTFSLLGPAIQTKLNEIKTNITLAIAGWKGAIEGKISEFVTVGGDIIGGLVNGIKNGAAAVVAALSGIIDEAVKASMAMLGIQSPSKVFAGIGHQIMAGMAQGIGAGFQLPVHAMLKGLPLLNTA